MEAKELRIGNYVSSKANTVIEVSGWELYNFTVRENNSEDILVKPIQLTEEWLIKFGLTEKNKKGFGTFQDVSSRVIITFNYANNGLQLDRRVKLEYVHQLQNLYFALTGEELTIKE